MQITKEYMNNRAIQGLVGPNNVHLHQIEEQMKVQIFLNGNQMVVEGSSRDVPMTSEILDSLYITAQRKGDISEDDIIRAVAATTQGDVSPQSSGDLSLKTQKRHISPRTQMQAEFIQAMNDYEMVFGLGPAGTGKTFLAVAKAVSLMLEGKVDKIILTRPAVEAGENLGFLPGDLKEKIDPYLRPLYDALYDMLPSDQVQKRLASGEIEIAPLAYMRGRTLSHAVVILDEAQNTTAMQMKMFLTRLGEGSRMVINGDLSQTDLPKGMQSGLADAVSVCRVIPQIKIIQFSAKDVVRHGLVSQIINAYDERGRQQGNPA